MRMVVHLLGYKSAQNDSIKKVNLRGHSMLHKNAKKCEEIDTYYTELIIHLRVHLRGTPEGTFDIASKDPLSDLHKDT